MYTHAHTCTSTADSSNHVLTLICTHTLTLVHLLQTPRIMCSRLYVHTRSHLYIYCRLLESCAHAYMYTHAHTCTSTADSSNHVLTLICTHTLTPVHLLQTPRIMCSRLYVH